MCVPVCCAGCAAPEGAADVLKVTGRAHTPCEPLERPCACPRAVLQRFVKKREVADVCKIREVLLRGVLGGGIGASWGRPCPCRLPACEPEGPLPAGSPVGPRAVRWQLLEEGVWVPLQMCGLRFKSWSVTPHCFLRVYGKFSERCRELEAEEEGVRSKLRRDGGTRPALIPRGD